MGAPAGPGARLGRAGEKAAAAFLQARGFRIVGAGFLARRGEIDLVCRRDDGLYLVEVKTRAQDAYGTPAEAVDRRKRRALRAAAAEYRALSEWRGPIHFAVIAIRADPDGSVRTLDFLEDPF
jgi:putative endonuclease